MNQRVVSVVTSTVAKQTHSSISEHYLSSDERERKRHAAGGGDADRECHYGVQSVARFSSTEIGR